MQQIAGGVFDFSFNSTLVRLEGKAALVKKYSSEVSIPLWFDWKHGNIFIQKKNTPFQFHFGSIGSEKVVNLIVF